MGSFPHPPVRLKLSRSRGFSLHRTSLLVNGNSAVKVDRSTHWGNPFRVLHDDRRQAIAAHREWMLMDTPHAYLRRGRAIVELRGKNLACWCPLPGIGRPDLCHAATLLEVANDLRPAHPVALLALLGALCAARTSGCGSDACVLVKGVSQRECGCVAAAYAAATGATRWEAGWQRGGE